ncbi:MULTISPECIES: WG repeat-containing protein [unclassified Aureispira]|uniref:WG repeat-containing protein n=1 Tax=unclassified Aureispira TaxID=2649989 RepID=UPI000697F111|nr:MULTISPECIES: WG repeat-containing protein [unclassified Aureispira]WMX13956.1 WG repeat-containing protein [Aureispira sp. CCB-E]
MHYKISIFFTLFFTLQIAVAQQDSSNYQKKYAFQIKDPTEGLEKGQEFLYVDGIYKVWDGERFNWGFYDDKTKEKLTKAKYDTITYRYLHQEKKGFYRIKENGKWGMLGDDRSVWVPVQYDALNYISKRQHPYISIEIGDKYGVLNTDGTPVLEAIYDDILFDGYRYKVKKGAKWGLKNAKGEELIPTCFDQIGDHQYISHTRVKIGKKWSVYNWIKDNPCQTEKKYDDIDYFSRYFVVREQGKFGLLDINAKEILPFEYDFMSPFFLKYLNSVLVGKDKKVGLLRIDTSDQVHTAVPIEYSDIWIDENNFKLKVRLGDKIDYYYNDQTLFDLAYNDVQYYEDINRVMVKKGTKWGMLTVEGEQIIPIAYSKIHVMNANQFMVQKGTKWGVLNGQGKEMIPVIYDQFDYRPKKKFFFVLKNGKWGIVSITKGVILPPKYEDMYALPNRTYMVKVKGLWGVVAAGGRVIVPAEYSSYKYKYKNKEVVLIHPDGHVKKYPLR